jgi:DNA-binding IclR family transcriptional regulator
MENLSDEEKRVLLALNELEPATLEQIATKSALEPGQIQEVLQKLLKKGLLGQLGSNHRRRTKEMSAPLRNDTFTCAGPGADRSGIAKRNSRRRVGED